MSTRGLRVSTMGVAILFALMTGFFYSFSVTVMPGLDVTPPEAAILGMQGINRAVRSGLFFATFFLGPVLAALVAVWMFLSGHKHGALKLLLAAIIYGVGVIAITAQVNVPMNESLAQVTGVIANPEPLWTAFSERWTNWNTVRTLLSGIAMVLTMSALPVGQYQKRRE